MRVFLTGATGFIGSALATALRERGDDVVALVRSPGQASDLAVQGCELVEGDLSNVGTLKRGMDGADAVIHAAAIYEVGVREDRWPDMLDTNVDGTERVLDAAAFAGVPRIVYISTVNALGNTEGAVADEQTSHHGRYVSQYDKTKHMADEVAELSFVYRDDVVDGILAVLDRGRIGEKYILSGENATLREFIAAAGEATYDATHGKATAELGFQPRPLAQGLRDTLLAEGRL